MGKIVAQDDGRRVTVYEPFDFALVVPLATQFRFGLLRGQPFVLKKDGTFERQIEVAREASSLRGGVSFAPVEAERQTHDHPFDVKLSAQLGHVAQESLPVRARQGGERAGRQAQFVRERDADPLRPDVEREEASRRSPSDLVRGVLIFVSRPFVFVRQRLRSIT
jgi:hypothetical protein